jgi:hypothetical protein
LQGTNAQAKQATVKQTEENRTTDKSQESANHGGSASVCSDDGKYVEIFFYFYTILRYQH